jgi:hypothetical protein
MDRVSTMDYHFGLFYNFDKALHDRELGVGR